MVEFKEPRLKGQLLNYPTYLIGARFDRRKKVDTYDILDAASLTLLGVAAEIEPTFWLKVLRWVWGRNFFPSEIRVWGRDDPSPLFLIREINGLWCPRLQVSEADGHPFCYFRGIFATLGGGFTVQNVAGVRIGELDSPTGERSYRLLIRDGRELGTIVQITPPPDKPSVWVDSYFVTINELTEGRSAANVLLLAAALALDLVFRERV